MTEFSKYHNGWPSGTNGKGSNGTFPPQSRPTAKENANTFDAKKLTFTLWNRKWLILGVSLFCAVAAYLYSTTVTPIYHSEGSMIITKGSGGMPSGEGLTGLMAGAFGLGMGNTFANEMQVLQSRYLAQQIADTLLDMGNMKNGEQFPLIYEAYPDDSDIAPQDTVARRVRENLVVTQVDDDATVAHIGYESPSPLEAAFIVNAAMEIYQNISTRNKRMSASSAVKFLRAERKEIKQELEAAEQKLGNFMNRTGVVQVEVQTQELIKQIAELEARLQEAKTSLVAANAALERYKNQLNSIQPGLAEQFAEAISPKLTKLQFAKSEAEIARTQLLINNPRLKNTDNPPSQLVALNREIASYQEKIEELTTNLLNKSSQYLAFLGTEGGVAESVTALHKKIIELKVKQAQYQAQVDVISDKLSELNQFLDELPENIVQFAQLKRDVMINEQLYLTVSEQLAKTQLWQQTQFGLGRIIDSGYVPDRPISPIKPLYAVLGFLLGFIFSSGFVVARDEFNTTIDGVEKMRVRPEPLLSVVPQMHDHTDENHEGEEKVKVQGKEVSTKLVTVLDSISPISESFRRLQSNLIYSNPDIKLKSILLTSAGKGAGKSTTISNLGVVLAESGYKVAIVETDLRRPNVHNVFGLSETPGFMEILFDDVKPEEAIQDTIVPGLSVLTSGRKPPNPSTVTQSKAFLKTIKDLEKSFDYVLIDTPPFGIITDSSALLKQSDGVVVAARFNKTTEVQLDHTLEQLHRIKANVLGTVLTAFDHTKSSDLHYSSSYYKEVYQDYETYEES